MQTRLYFPHPEPLSIQKDLLIGTIDILKMFIPAMPFFVFEMHHIFDRNVCLMTRTQQGISLTEEGRLFYDRCADNLPRGWIKRMKNCIQTLGLQFNTHRMVAEYVQRYDLHLDEATVERMKKFRNLYQSEAENI